MHPIEAADEFSPEMCIFRLTYFASRGNPSVTIRRRTRSYHEQNE
jgi:hypothetical protein